MKKKPVGNESVATGSKMNQPIFDFTKNETLKFEKIVKAAFSSPNRNQIVFKNSEARLLPVGLEADFLKIVFKKLTNTVEEFDMEEFKLYDTDKLFAKIDKKSWLNDLKNSCWNGPVAVTANNGQMYIPSENLLDSEYFEISTCLAGNRCGLVLRINLSAKSLSLIFVSSKGEKIGNQVEILGHDYD